MSTILTNSPVLSQFVNKLEQLSKINRAVQKKLDKPLAHYCRVANLRDGVLILTTPSSIWGHQLRFQEIDLLSALRAEPEWCGLKSIQTRVVPEQANTSFSEHSPSKAFPGFSRPSISSFSAAIVQETARNITSQNLQKALLKLSQRSNGPAQGPVPTI